MSIEAKIDELIAAFNESTLALRVFNSGLSTASASMAAAEPKRTRASKAAAPAPAEAAPAPAPAASKGPTANDLKKFVKDERTRLTEVSGEAVKKHKEESAKILKSFGLVDFTSIPDDKVEAMLAKFKALNVEQPTEKDELEDDDNDGL